jgi:heme/copper-type cytochrome/quinol oxidase subunit 2
VIDRTLSETARRMMVAPVNAVLLTLMGLGCLMLWVGLPFVWLWIGSKVQASTSIGTALMVMMVGFVACVFILLPALTWMNRSYVELREAHEKPIGRYSPLEVMLVVSGALAVVGFVVWFFGFSGSSPIPINVGY